MFYECHTRFKKRMDIAFDGFNFFFFSQGIVFLVAQLHKNPKLGGR
jgi:hypothetical protein